jgi:chemotaxis protein CheX
MSANTINLPAILDLKAAGPLKAEILANAGSALDLDVSKVERVGGLCLQVLLAASETWRTAGLPFRLVHPSETARNDMRLLGANHLLPGVEAC